MCRLNAAQHSVHPISGEKRRSHTGTARGWLSKPCRRGGGTAARRGMTLTVSLLNKVSIQFVELKLCCSGTGNPTISRFPML